MQSPTMIRRQQIQHGASTTGVVAGADHPNRFVQQHHPRLLTQVQLATIDNDRLTIRISLITKAGDLTVDTNTTVLQPEFGLAP
jgi:hypothetical protein